MNWIMALQSLSQNVTKFLVFSHFEQLLHSYTSVWLCNFLAGPYFSIGHTIFLCGLCLSMSTQFSYAATLQYDAQFSFKWSWSKILDRGICIRNWSSFENAKNGLPVQTDAFLWNFWLYSNFFIHNFGTILKSFTISSQIQSNCMHS